MLLAKCTNTFSSIVARGMFPQRVVEHDVVQIKPFYLDMLGRRSEEVTSGTPRLARRADKMYSLLAPKTQVCSGSFTWKNRLSTGHEPTERG